jgi:hypothetical protein
LRHLRIELRDQAEDNEQCRDERKLFHKDRMAGLETAMTEAPPCREQNDILR